MFEKLNKLVFLFVALVIFFTLYKLFGAENVIFSANIVYLLFSILSYLVGIFLWNCAWAASGNFSFLKANLAGFASLSGMLTPAGVGNDFLRAYFLRKSVSFEKAIASSFVTKIYKILIAIFFSFLFVIWFLREKSYLLGALLLGIALPFAFIISIKYLLDMRTINFFKKYSKHLRKHHANLKKLSRYFNLYLKNFSALFLFLLVLSFFFEICSFAFAFYAFSINVSIVEALAAFSVLYLISKNPFVPQGIGVVELLAIFAFSAVSQQLIAAALIVWDISRLWIPILSSVFFLPKVNK